MNDERTFAFELTQAVRTRDGVMGIVMARAADPDAVSFREIAPMNGKAAFEEIRTPVNAYQVGFDGDNGRPDSAWWHEDMLVPVAK